MLAKISRVLGLSTASLSLDVVVMGTRQQPLELPFGDLQRRRRCGSVTVDDDGWVSFDTDGKVWYVFSDGTNDVEILPQAGVIPVNPGTSYDLELPIEFQGAAPILWIGQYSEGAKVAAAWAETSVPPSPNSAAMVSAKFRSPLTAESNARTLKVGVRLKGAGRFRLGPLCMGPRAATENQRFDLSLFIALNKEYENKRTVPKPRKYDPASLKTQAETRVAQLDAAVGLAGKRVLEIGCGHGEMAQMIAENYGCHYTGLDITTRDSWSKVKRDNVEFKCYDITKEDPTVLGQFDVIFSLVVWEHIEHPFAALSGVKKLLAPEGKFYLYTNLQRGTIASHCFRDVFFPWPHLLFSDDVFEEYYKYIGKAPTRPPFVNKMTAAHYYMYFEMLSLQVDRVWFTGKKFDQKFYDRFVDMLGRYPLFDLKHDFLHAVLVHKKVDTAPVWPAPEEMN